MATLVSAPLVQYGFAFGDGTTNQFAFGGAGQGVQVLSVEGLESFPNLRTQDTSRGYMDGAFSGRDFLDARTVTFHLQIMSDGVTSFQTYLAELQEYLMIQRSGTSVLQVFLPGGRGVRRLYGRVRRREIQIDPSYVYGRAEALLEFYCPDPRIYNNAVTSYTVNSLSAFTRSYNKTYNMTYPTAVAGASGSQNVTNQGNYETWPVFTLTGTACTGPTITNTTTTDVLSFPSLSMGAGDTLVIDSDLRTVLFNGIPSRNLMTSASRWFSLPAGTTQNISLSTVSGNQNCTITYRDAYI